MINLSKFGVELHQAKLKNGADIFLFKRKGMPIFLRATFFAGSRFDTIPGTAHFLEHMLLAGTEKFPTKNLIANHIHRVGGEFGASTDNTFLRFDIEIPESQDINIGLEVLSECLTNSLIDEKTFENERGAILSELKSKKSNPREYIRELRRELVLQGTPAGRSTLGDEADIKAITRQGVLDYRDQYIHSGRLAIIASGDIDIETLVKGLDTINFSNRSRFAAENKLPVIKDENLGVKLYEDTNQLQVSLAARTDVENYNEYCALKVLSSILGEGRGSKLITKLRYENGLVYSISSGIYNTADWGMLTINFSCDKEHLNKVRELIFETLGELKLNNISSAELEDAMSKISKGAISRFQPSKAWVEFHEDDALFSPSQLHTAEGYIHAINSLTLEDTQRVINKYLTEENFLMAVCGNYKQ
ncbi:MAG: pitrilysin family protein [bacterium]|nr:pitrilysin family protein [bacterium]